MTENIQILTPTLILNDNDNKYDLDGLSLLKVYQINTRKILENY